MTRLRRSGLVLAALTLLLGAGPSSVAGQETTRDGPPTGAELDALTARVADQLRCPVCRNQSVGESSSELARQMQAEIRRRLARGETPEEVRAYFVSRYGEWILLQPPPKGINLLVYLLPLAALVAGGWIVFRLVRRWSEAGASEASEPAGGASGDRKGDPGDLSEEEEQRLREAMGSGSGTS